MQRVIRKFLWVLLLAAGLQSSWAFSLLGPVAVGDDAWQVTLIGYNPLDADAAPPYLIDPLLTGPKQINEGYRRNAGVLVYASDYYFQTFFGSNGVVAVDQAYAILNQAMTNNPTGVTNGVDGYSASLSEIPLSAKQLNYTASGLGIYDIKSFVLHLMVEQLGLADSIRYTYALHNRYVPGGAVCNAPGPGYGVEYTVIMRNFDLSAVPVVGNSVSGVAGLSSPYVNGVLYTYTIVENCGAQNASPPNADAIEFTVDPLATGQNAPVSSAVETAEWGAGWGEFYTGLTRDDVAGLRWLMSSNTWVTEVPAAGSQLEDTNNPTTLVTTLDLGALVTSAQTNSPAVLATLFPNVIVASSSSYFTNVISPNIVIYATNYPGSAYGTPPTLITITNGFTNAIVQRYVTTFANVITNSYSAKSQVASQTTTFGAQIGAPVGSPFVTKTTTSKPYVTNTPTGDYYILPAGSCGLNVVRVWQTNVIATTNLIASGTSLTSSALTTRSLVTYFTNHILEVLPCNLVPPTPRLYGGVQKIQFVRANFDNLLSQTFTPVTNTYTMVTVTNGQALRQTFQRIVTQPDFLMTSSDFAPGPSTGPAFGQVPYNRTITFDQTQAGTHAGPGVIYSPTAAPATTFNFNQVGTVFLNEGAAYVNGPDGLVSFIWGSFDGTTNLPVVYPNSLSLQNLQSELLIQISPTSLTNASNGSSYSVTLSVTGGQSPYSWALSPGSQLPNGLNLSANGVISGTPTNVPSGLYNFTIQMTDAANRVVNVSYTITIN